jgi:hypothetical protein
MGYSAYLLVAVLLNSWIIAFLGYGAGSFIHVLLFLAFIVIALRGSKRSKLLGHIRQRV